MELVRFDLQKMMNPEISGVEYQQGELAGYEVKEYLLEKWHRRCTYCEKEGVPLQVEHIAAKANGGTNRVSNLCLACEPCNQKKGALHAPKVIKFSMGTPLLRAPHEFPRSGPLMSGGNLGELERLNGPDHALQRSHERSQVDEAGFSVVFYHAGSIRRVKVHGRRLSFQVGPQALGRDAEPSFFVGHE